MQISVNLYLMRRQNRCAVTPVCPGVFDWSIVSRDGSKARGQAVEKLRKLLPKVHREDFGRIFSVPGRRLQRLRLEFTVDADGEKRQVSGLFPLIVEPVKAGETRLTSYAYHPLRPTEWFEVDPSVPLEEQARQCFARAFTPFDDFDELRSDRKEQLLTVRFNAHPPSLLSLLKKSPEKDGEYAGAGVSGELGQLLLTAVNETRRASEGEFFPGVARPALRQRLAQLLCGSAKTPFIVVGAEGAGKSTVVGQGLRDLLEAEDFAAHRNVDRVHNVIRVSGRQIIAGMSFVGQWEARCVALLAASRGRRLILWVDDLHAWAQIGRATGSDRSLADFFQGPIARHELMVIGECTPEQLSVLQHEAPALARAFTIVVVPEADERETLAMMLDHCRRLEQESLVQFEPRCFRQIVEMSRSLLAGSSFPGRALLPLRGLGLAAAGAKEGNRSPKLVSSGDVVRYFSQQTGLPEVLLSPELPLSREVLRRELGQRIMGQGEGLECACDLILGIRTGLCPPGRPYGVFLFTGPTGTGKTELAKCLAAYLYGRARRLIRFDMGEFSGTDAVARLIGDRWIPEGQLTGAVRAQPFSVLLFDEIEKAHPSVLNLMLQIFDDGRLTDASGSVADFSHTVIVMTSNLGGANRSVHGFMGQEASRAEDIAGAVRAFFPPELFNRIDRVVPFSALSLSVAREIAIKELTGLAARPGLTERNIFLRFTNRVVEQIVSEGYSVKYGARSLKRSIEVRVADLLARSISAESSAEMRLAWIYWGSGGIALHTEALREAVPESTPSLTEPLLGDDIVALRGRIPAALRTLEQLGDEGLLARLSESVAAELDAFRLAEERTRRVERGHQLFSLDSLRGDVARIRSNLEHRQGTDRGLQRKERERKHLQQEQLDGEDFSAFDDEPMAPHPRSEQEDPFSLRVRREHIRPIVPCNLNHLLLPELVELTFLQQLLAHVGEPNQHVVLVEITRLAVMTEVRRFSGGNPGLLEWLVESYVGARGQLESAAVTLQDGTIQPAKGLTALVELLEQRPESVALQLVGPGISRFLAAEAGCHLRRTPGAAPEVVRVSVLPGVWEPEGYLNDQSALRAKFEQALEASGGGAANPDHLPPVVRRIGYAPQPGKLSEAIVEDYRFCRVVNRRVRNLEEALRELWIFAAGRTVAR